jgi:hypothetical protein
MSSILQQKNSHIDRFLAGWKTKRVRGLGCRTYSFVEAPDFHILAYQSFLPYTLTDSSASDTIALYVSIFVE